ncbi:hypothetical protein ADIS_4360 [Lunatimonas lonarensis]|uniref:Uncharacterized protein n=2 Tax=Lunatimonas lonarensis TaxID=1232681 RepID=R7ZMF4_9BACT|nr:hypothetical protein ADIS_4360 [Lunatimonas lonarensis]
MDGLEARRPREFVSDDFSDGVRDFFHAKSLLMAHALYLTKALEQWVEAADQGKGELEQFIRYQEIVNKISLAELEVSSLKAAIHCEEDKVDQLAWYLDRLQRTTSSRRTIAGILTDASISLVSAGIVLWAANGNTLRQLLGVGASLTQITLNLVNRKETFVIRLDHELNILQEVFAGEADEWSQIIPPSVWYYLHAEETKLYEGSIQEKLLNTIEPYEVSGNLSLFLSDGGIYTAEELQVRSAMLDILASYVDLMKQDLLAFRREVMEFRRGSEEERDS